MPGMFGVKPTLPKEQQKKLSESYMKRVGLASSKPTYSTTKSKKTKTPSSIVKELESKGSAYIPSKQAARILPALKKDLEERFPGRRITYERNRLKVHEPAQSRMGGLGDVVGVAKTLAGDVEQIGTGIAGMAADYGEAGVKDFKDFATAKNARAALRGDFRDIRAPLQRTGRLAWRDILGTVGALETAIPEPSFLPDALRKEVLTVDPQKLRVGKGSGRIDPEDSARAAKMWREDPLIAAATVAPFAGYGLRRASIGQLTRSIRKANPDLPMKQVKAIARKESKQPGYAAAQGVKGGIEPRMLQGEYGTAQARPWSRSPEGRALQRFYDRQSAKIEERNPGRKFSTSQRAQRQAERLDRRSKQQADLEADLVERTVWKTARNDKAKREALVAVLEGPKGVTPREAVELRLADLRTQATAAIDPDRSKIRLMLDNRIAALEKALEGDWLDSPKALKAADEMESLSAYLDEQYKILYPDADDVMLAARRDKLVNRYAQRGLIEEGAEGRGYYPHVDTFEDVYSGRGGPVVPAKGDVVGVPRKTKWATKQQNRLARYEAGRVAGDPKVLAFYARGRNKLIWDIKARRDLYDVGDEITDLSEITDDMMVVRNPDAPPTRLDADVRAALDDPDVFADRLTPEFTTKAQESWLFDPRRGMDRPEWLVDVKNVRLVPRNLVRTRMADVFPAAPQGLQANVAAVVGTLNSLARFAAIYTPYGGARYVLRNTPQNMILLALTKPSAFRNVGESTRGLRKADYDLYKRIEDETGSVPAAAGLPDLAGRRLGKAQKAEAGVTWASRKTAGALGEISDQPWRIASWIQYAKDYGFETRADWRRLIDSDDPNVVRVRNDISQRVREDMIDFDSLSPVERESIARFLFIYPFVKGAAKWPLVYVRERPIQSAIFTLLTTQHSREGADSVYEQGVVELGGRNVQLGTLIDPTSPARGTAEDLATIAKEGNPYEIWTEGPQDFAQALLGMAAPQYREPLKPYDDPEGWKRALIPGYSTASKLGEGGSVGDQTLRGLSLEAMEPRSQKRVTKRRDNLAADLEQIGRAQEIDNPYIGGALKLQSEWSELMDGQDSVEGKWKSALDAAASKGFITRKRSAELKKWAATQTEHDQELFLDRIEYHYFGEKVLRRVREYVNEQLREKGLEPSS